jgi:hypothetical protein
MTRAEAIETTRIHSAAGRTGDRTAFATTHLFWVLHHRIVETFRRGSGPMPERCRWRTEEASRQHLATIAYRLVSFLVWVLSCVARTTQAVSLVRTFDRLLTPRSDDREMLLDSWGWRSGR